MNLIGAITLATFTAANTRGAGFQMFEKHEVTVCMDRNADSTIVRAQAIASGIYDRVGIRIRWSRRTAGCTVARNSIVVNLLDEAQPAQHPGSLAVSAPYQGKDIVLYYDRVRALGRNQPSILLGYVLAHEIAHILQGITRHSDEGVLKSHWDSRDHASMRHTALRFTEEDVDLIRRGLDTGQGFPQCLQPGSTGAIGPQ